MTKDKRAKRKTPAARKPLKRSANLKAENAALKRELAQAHQRLTDALGDRHQSHAIRRKSADVEFKLELVAEEAAEAVDQDYIERAA
jgi:hypothetical protein